MEVHEGTSDISPRPGREGRISTRRKLTRRSQRVHNSENSDQAAERVVASTPVGHRVLLLQVNPGDEEASIEPAPDGMLRVPSGHLGPGAETNLASLCADVCRPRVFLTGLSLRRVLAAPRRAPALPLRERPQAQLYFPRNLDNQPSRQGPDWPQLSLPQGWDKGSGSPDPQHGPQSQPSDHGATLLPALHPFHLA